MGAREVEEKEQQSDKMEIECVVGGNLTAQL